MAATLTERQQEVLKLVKSDARVADIAKDLGISENGVYQQIRRLRQTGHLPKSKGARKGGRKSARKRSSSPRLTATASNGTFSVSNGTTGQSGNGNDNGTVIDPVAAVRTRLAEVKDQRSRIAAAVKDCEKAEAGLSDEQKRLEKGLSALTGRPLTVRRKPRAKQEATA